MRNNCECYECGKSLTKEEAIFCENCEDCYCEDCAKPTSGLHPFLLKEGLCGWCKSTRDDNRNIEVAKKR